MHRTDVWIPDGCEGRLQSVVAQASSVYSGSYCLAQGVP